MVFEGILVPPKGNRYYIKTVTIKNGQVTCDYMFLSYREHSELKCIQFRCSVLSDSLRSHGLQHARPCCPSPTPRVHPNPCPDAIQPSHPLSSPSPPAFNISQHQGFFQRVSSLHQVAKVLEFQLQRQSFQ